MRIIDYAKRSKIAYVVEAVFALLLNALQERLATFVTWATFVLVMEYKWPRRCTICTCGAGLVGEEAID